MEAFVFLALNAQKRPYVASVFTLSHIPCAPCAGWYRWDCHAPCYGGVLFLMELHIARLVVRLKDLHGSIDVV